MKYAAKLGIEIPDNQAEQEKCSGDESDGSVDITTEPVGDGDDDALSDCSEAVSAITDVSDDNCFENSTSYIPLVG